MKPHDLIFIVLGQYLIHLYNGLRRKFWLWCKNNKRSDLTLFDNHLRASLLIIRLMIVTLKNQRG